MSLHAPAMSIPSARNNVTSSPLSDERFIDSMVVEYVGVLSHREKIL